VPLDQLGHLGDEALGYPDSFGRQFRRDIRTWAGLIIGDGFKVVGEAKEGTQFVIDACISPDQPVKFRLHSAVSSNRASGSLGDQRLRGMEPGEVCRAACCFVEIDVEHGIGLGEQPPGFGDEVSGFRRQSSIPSRRISRISGVRSL
jgi:hypothetical protein